MSILSLVNKFSYASINAINKKNLFTLIKLFLASVIIVLIGSSFSEAAKKKDEKDCQYCEKYETLEDWPESERPEAFIYEEVNYPEGMFHKNNNTSFKRINTYE